MRKSARTADTGVNLTPMLDIVFIMLIFFIVTATFTKEWAVDINQPKPGPVTPTEAENMIIAIDGNNQILLGNRVIDVRSVRANIEQWAAPNPTGTLVIQPDQDAHTGLLIQIHDQAMQANVRNIVVAETN